jgi:hypothetical protein
MPARSGASSASDVHARSPALPDRASDHAELLTAAAVRERSRIVHDWVAAGRSAHFTLAPAELDKVAAYVAEVTREAYPDLKIPAHSRWRHFCAGGIDRWANLAASMGADPLEQARVAIDLATVSVLLDAGAGSDWHYRERSSGQRFARSEGLAVASFNMFTAGGFSSEPGKPFRADGAGLAEIDDESLARFFHVDAGNPLIGVERRARLLRQLGAALAARPDLFGGAQARPGNLVDHFLRTHPDRTLPAAAILATLLDGLSSIWPSGLTLHGRPLGDAGRHPAVQSDPDRIVPFHKLSQWLTYSLIEPLADAGFDVVRLDELTALPEYRNGGLLVDLGVIRPRHKPNPDEPYAVTSELVVEWRALTVTLMDRLLPLARGRLGLGADFALPNLLQGGTWSAGRKIALALRPPNGPPPLPIAADGTVF